MNVRRAVGWATALASVAGVVLLVVAITEAVYAINHPDSYGPAVMIAIAAAAGCALAVALVLACAALFERGSSRDVRRDEPVWDPIAERFQ